MSYWVAMTTALATMDRFGRLVIPKKLREAAGLQPGVRLRLDYTDGRIHIEPDRVGVRLEQRGHVLCAVPDEPVPELGVDEVNAIIHALRHRG